MEDGLEKSNRSKADLFEVLISQFLIKHYKLDKDYSEEIKNLKEYIKKSFEDFDIRIKEQEERASLVLKPLIPYIDKIIEKNGKIIDIKWIGRLHQVEKTLSDVDVSFSNDLFLGLSLKSTRSGFGTQKNLGLKTVKKYLYIDIEKQYEDMWVNVKEELKRLGLKDIAKLGRTSIRHKKYEFSVIKLIGKRFGLPLQKDSIQQSVENFNKLSSFKKRDFLKCIFGIEDNKLLLNILVRGNRVNIKWNKEYNSIISGKNLKAKIINDKSYSINVDEETILRVQSSFTNGIGISAFCQRAFLKNF